MPRQTVSRAVKRRIEKSYSEGNEISPSTETTNVVHTVEDAKTLVRAIVELHLVPLSSVDTDIDAMSEVMLHVKPKATAVASLNVTEQLDRDPPIQEIMKARLSCYVNATNNVSGSTTRTYDIKGMRKLFPGDTINFDHISNESSVSRLSWTVKLFFKE